MQNYVYMSLPQITHIQILDGKVHHCFLVAQYLAKAIQ